MLANNMNLKFIFFKNNLKRDIVKNYICIGSIFNHFYYYYYYNLNYKK